MRLVIQPVISMCPRRRSRTHGGGRAGRALGRAADLFLRRISAGCRAQPSMRLTPSRQPFGSTGCLLGLVAAVVAEPHPGFPLIR